DTLPRRYTVTHTDRTADLHLFVGSDYDQVTLNEPLVREQGDQVLAELTDGTAPRLIVRCALQPPEDCARRAAPHTRREILKREMPLVLASIRYGDRFFFERHPELDQAEVVVQFESQIPLEQDQRELGRIAAYRVTQIAGEGRRLAAAAAAVAAVGIGGFVIGKLRNRSG